MSPPRNGTAYKAPYLDGNVNIPSKVGAQLTGVYRQSVLLRPANPLLRQHPVVMRKAPKCPQRHLSAVGTISGSQNLNTADWAHSFALQICATITVILTAIKMYKAG